MSDYIQWVSNQEKLEVPDWLPKQHECSLAGYQFERFTDLVMTRLRTSEGLDLDWVRETYVDGDSLVQAILEGASLGLELGLVERYRFPTNDADTLRLVDPNGFLYSNTIISSIFLEMEGSDVRCKA